MFLAFDNIASSISKVLRCINKVFDKSWINTSRIGPILLYSNSAITIVVAAKSEPDYRPGTEINCGRISARRSQQASYDRFSNTVHTASQGRRLAFTRRPPLPSLSPHRSEGNHTDSLRKDGLIFCIKPPTLNIRCWSLFNKLFVHRFRPRVWNLCCRL